MPAALTNNKTQRANSCLKLLGVATAYLAMCLITSVTADMLPANQKMALPAIAIIIDDIGHRGDDSARAVNLPGPVAYAVLPHTPFANAMASKAHADGKEVMLHLPLEATSNNELLGPGAIALDDSVDAFQQTLAENLAAIPHVVGINNHMGSLLTRHPGHMRWLMEAMRNDSALFFVDSFTTERSVAFDVAKEYGIPTTRRDVFLDGERTVAAVRRQFAELKETALEHGYAVAIGHPFPETLSVLEAELPKLKKQGFRLVSVKDIISMQVDNEYEHDSSSREPSIFTDNQIEMPGAQKASPVAK